MNEPQKNGYYFREFREIKQLGCGGFGTVFEAVLKSDKTSYAVKKVALKITERKWSLNEVIFLNELNGNENIVGYFGNWFECNYYRTDLNQNQICESLLSISRLNSLSSDKLDEILHIQLQLCKMTLKDVIDKVDEYNSKHANSSHGINPFVFNIALELVSQIVKGLKHFHKNSIIHRDITPGNILISADYLAKITDLGLAVKGEGDSVYDKKFKYATHIYRPEEFSYGCYEPGTDLYSVGIIAEQLFCIYPLTDEFVENSFGEQRVICELIQKLTSDEIRERGSCDNTLSIIEELKFKYTITCDLETFLKEL